MANGPPRIVLIGKGSGKKAAETHKWLGSIEPSSIPPQAVDSLIVETNTGIRYKVDSQYISNGIKTDLIESHLREMGMTDTLSSIEIIIDLHRTKVLLESETNALLSQYFTDDI